MCDKADMDTVISKLVKYRNFRDKIEHVEHLSGQDAEFGFVKVLNPNFIRFLEDKGISLYKHQVESFNYVRARENIIITTPTASGKTFSFNLPVLEVLDNNPDATALYIYPAKALTYDQLDVLKGLEEGLGFKFNPASYDGDTPKNLRYSIRQNSRLVLTNPYQLHHILAWHHQWSRFYSNLKFVVIDEAHFYKGVFGSNVAFLIRRLKRICNEYGSNPQFILSSATLANPLELASNLTGEDNFKHVFKDTSPSGDKDFILYNPYKDEGNKKSSTGNSIHQESELIFLFLLLNNVQTLCFTVSRKIAELIAVWTKRDMANYKRKFISRITAYRAGYLAEDRREIEEGLKSRKYLGVTSTNALELGINIGSLDAVIISGYPGTMISVWQQGGRAGRGINKSLVVLVAFENQLDQYFMKHPEFFFDKAHENIVIDLNNPNIIKSHLLCAANELAFDFKEAHNYFNADLKLLDSLVKNKELSMSNKLYLYPYDDSPSFKYSLDNLSNDYFTVHYKDKVLEVMERSQVYNEAHPGAVLINRGDTYIVKELDLYNRQVFVRKADVEFHTTVLKDININIKKKINKTNYGDLLIHFGELEVLEDYHKYKKMQYSETKGVYVLDLPPLKFRTKGIWFTIPDELKKEIEKKYTEKDAFAGGLHGAEHALIGLFPLNVVCDRFDIGGMSTNYHEDTQEATIFIYDAYEDGIGISEKASKLFNKLVKSTKELLDTCNCKDGCPSCIYSPKCGNDNKPLHKKATIDILNYLNKEITKNQKIEIEEKPKITKYQEALEHFNTGNYIYAKDICHELLIENNKNPDAYYLLGAILEKQEDKQGAIMYLKRAIKLNPTHIEANELLIQIK